MSENLRDARERADEMFQKLDAVDALDDLADSLEEALKL